MIGELLQELRKDKGLTQLQLAKEMGLSASTIGAYETDVADPPVEMLVKLCDYFDVSIDYLTGRIRSRVAWQDIFSGIKVGDTITNIQDYFDILSQLSPEDRQIYLAVGEGLVFRSKDKIKTLKKHEVL